MCKLFKYMKRNERLDIIPFEFTRKQVMQYNDDCSHTRIIQLSSIMYKRIIKENILQCLNWNTKKTATQNVLKLYKGFCTGQQMHYCY